MIAYKAAESNGKRILITLEIPSDALTNIGRASVVVKESAKYRANKAKVLRIEDAEGNLYETAESAFFTPKLVYNVGEVLEEKGYNYNTRSVCSRGIHFFLEKQVAEQYMLKEIPEGVLTSWYDTGQKHTEQEFKGGKRNGRFTRWYENGAVYMEGNYTNGKEEGLFVSWHENGQKYVEATYKDGLLHGTYLSWYEDCVKSHEYHYKDGKADGLVKSWYETGALASETRFKDGNVLNPF